MTVATFYSGPQISACNGATTLFPVGFQYAAASELIVDLIDDATGDATQLVEGADYTRSVAGTGMTAPTSVTTLTAYPAGKSLSRRRETELGQSLSLPPNSLPPSALMELAWDRATLIAQEQAADGAELRSRALLVNPAYAPLPVGDLSDGNGMALGIVDDVIVPVPNGAAEFAVVAAEAIGTVQGLRDDSVAAAADADADAGATAADRVQTGQDVISSAANAAAAAASLAAVLTADAARGVYPIAAASNVPRGLTQASVGAITPGSGGTTGIFALTWSSGNFLVNPTGTFTVSGGAVIAVTITGPGLYIGASPTVPTPGFAASSGLSGAGVVLTAQFLAASGEGYWVQSADNLWLRRYHNASGTATATSGVGPIKLNDLLAQLPACVQEVFPCDEGAGSAIRGILNGNAAALTPIGAVGTIDWSDEGWLRVIGSSFLLPAMSHRGFIIVGREPETYDYNSYWVCTSSSEAFGRKAAASSLLSSVRTLHGWGIATPHRNADGSGMVALEGGGWHAPAAIFAATRTGQAAICAAQTSGVAPNPFIEIAMIIPLNAVPSDAEMLRIRNYIRARMKARGIYLTVADCPEQATLIVADGESTDEGRWGGIFTASFATNVMTVAAVLQGELAVGQEVFRAPGGIDRGTVIDAQLTSTEPGGGLGLRGTYRLSTTPGTLSAVTVNTIGLSASEMAVTADKLRVLGANATNFSAVGLVMARLSLFGAYSNNAAIDSVGAHYTSGWERGLLNALAARPDFGREIHLAKLAQGSTFLLMAGDGVATSLTDYAKASFTATISGNSLIVSAVSSGLPMIGDRIAGSGVGSRVITGYGTIAGDGTGTYSLGGAAQTVSSPTAMTATRSVLSGNSRNPAVLAGGGLAHSIVGRNLAKIEGHARLRGIGYASVIFLTSEGLNDATFGDVVITGAAFYRAYLDAKYAWYQAITGIENVTWVIVKPHLPYGGGLGGPDTTYANNVCGQSALNALNFIRAAIDAIVADNPGSVFSIDGQDHEVSSYDFVHPSKAGNGTLGAAIDGLGRDRTLFRGAVTSNVLTVTSTGRGALRVGQELMAVSQGVFVPAGVVIESLGTGTGGLGTYNLSACPDVAADTPFATVALYERPIALAA